MGLRLILALVLIVIADPVRSKTSCGFEDHILRISKHILQNRTALPSSRTRFTGDATYLRLRYDNIEYEAGKRLIRTLLDEKVYGAKDLAFTYVAANEGLDAAFELIGPKPRPSANLLYISAYRAFILSDGGVSYFRDPKKRDLFENKNLPSQAPIFATASIMDQSDDFKLRFARLAEASAKLDYAGMVLMSRSNLDAFHAFVGRHRDDQRTYNLLSSDPIGMTLHHNTGPITRDIASPTGPSHTHRMLYSVARAAYLIGDPEFLIRFLNVTGLLEEIAAVAEGLIGQIELKGEERVQDAEIWWVLAYQMLVERIGRSEVEKQFKALTTHLYEAQSHHWLDTISWIIASRALKPFLRDPTAPMVDRPELLSVEFEWERWARLARDVRDGGALSADDLDEADVRIVAELLYQADEIDRLFLFLTKQPAPYTAIDILYEMMKRLDRRCGAYSIGPGNPGVYRRRSFYEFPKRRQ